MVVEVHAESKTFTFKDATTVKQEGGHLYLIKPTAGGGHIYIGVFAPGTWNYAYQSACAEVASSKTEATKASTVDRGHIELDPNEV
ncbi:hypothetical protein DL990_13625 [Amycolatopsis sp. WAC 01416]|uniref:hypothetical protein n=1 Tax=Amycolatopsis sp. WAC 01416 TaxID=2203196 RepID=UPI000F7A1B8F|nr:hypothetical protein [Amycolatopsis sp. WAC 01416]RSN34671.1 hypothetical protein DL990_13625 [Amycolatopsis sp. WAC 01416]